MTDAQYLELLARLARIEAALSGRTSFDPKPAAPAVVEPASNADLDGQYGDPEIRFEPRYWTNAPIAGRRLSELTIDELRAYAQDRIKYAEWQDKNDKRDKKDRPASQWTRKDAALCLGWAKRKEAAGETAPRAQHRTTHVASMDDVDGPDHNSEWGF